MTLEIQSSDPEFESMNKYRHVTIATLKPNSKPFWSNMLLEDAAAGNPVHFIPLEISFTGSITGFFY
jgi:hypothetical protein